MTTQLEENAILEKTKALCQSIVDHLGMTSARRNINTFLADANARSQYEAVVNKGQALQEKKRKDSSWTAPKSPISRNTATHC